jgi:TolB protein
LRLDNLAQLLALSNYDAEAIALFTNLSTEEQIALFTNPTVDIQPQLERVIEKMMTTQVADSITADSESTRVLQAMFTALQTFDSLENSMLVPAIGSWLDARTAVLQDDLSAAQLAYSVSIRLNENNPAPLYERAAVALALSDYEAALADLTTLLSFGEDWTNRVEHTIAFTPPLHPIITTNSQYADLVAFVPDPTSTTSLSTSTATNPPQTALPTDTLPPQPTVTVETAVLITTPLNIPQTPPSGLIVYTCFIDNIDQVCAIEADGSSAVQLTATDTTNWTASLTPNQESVLFSSSRTGRFGLYEADINGENVRNLLPPAQGDYAPVASPDGEKIAFTRAEDGNQNIWVMDRDGSNAEPITFITGDALGPAWSPDSQQIVYAQQLSGEESYTLIIINTDGSNPQPLLLPQENIGDSSDWSPDGNWVAFYAGSTNDRDIYVAAVDGTVTYRITEGGDNLAPSFSPDGNWVVFTSKRDGDNDLYMVRLDGSDLMPLTRNNSSDWQPYWGR